MIVFTHKISTRLQYILDFINKEISTPVLLTDNDEQFKNHTGARISYSNEKPAPDQFWINPHQLLFEHGISQQQVTCFEMKRIKAFFKTEDDMGFDIFAASFYLLSRYEEYLPHQRDIYGRFDHQNSVAFRENFLHLPLINIWLEEFKQKLQEKFSGLKIVNTPGNRSFKFIPTYDIDIAYSYRFKGLIRNLGGTFKSIVNRQAITGVRERIKVMSGSEKDPYDSFAWMDELNKKHQLQPIYFFNVAENPGRYDKNISPKNPAMQELIRQHSKQYDVGIHPSWQSGDKPGLIKKEIQSLESIIQKRISKSRQHYIRFSLPGTFRQLLEAGIQSDYSIGYGSINGFRASVACPFYFYDLQKEEQTNLLLHPFCFMEANSFFEQKFSPDKAMEELKHYSSIVKNVNGQLITIWHNTFLGTDKLFAGWREVYEQWIREVL